MTRFTLKVGANLSRNIRTITHGEGGQTPTRPESQCMKGSKTKLSFTGFYLDNKKKNGANVRWKFGKQTEEKYLHTHSTG